MAKILIPTPIRPYTDKQDAVDASGATVGELLADLTRRHSGLKAHLYNEQGKLRSFVNVYVNDEDIRYLQKEQTPVAANDTVSIIPSVAGGAGPEKGYDPFSTAAVAAMLDVAKRLTSGVVVTIFPDGAEKYLNESFWNVND